MFSGSFLALRVLRMGGLSDRRSGRDLFSSLFSFFFSDMGMLAADVMRVIELHPAAQHVDQVTQHKEGDKSLVFKVIFQASAARVPRVSMQPCHASFYYTMQPALPKEKAPEKSVEEDADPPCESEEEEVKIALEVSVGNKRRLTVGPIRVNPHDSDSPSPSRSNSWRTPRQVIKMLDRLREFYGADFIGDACAALQNALFQYYYTEEINAMQHAWYKAENAAALNRHLLPIRLCHTDCARQLRGISYWYCNPPYGKDKHKHDLTDWLRKCLLEAYKGVGVVALVPAPNGEVNRWHHVFGKAREVFFIGGRLCFGNPETGKEERPAKFGCVLIHWDPRLLCRECSGKKKDDADISIDTKIVLV